MIEIDGSRGEGGGQIVRTACGLAVYTRKPCHIFSIRSHRPVPGLRPQHLLGVRALAELSGGHTQGDFIGSTELVFRPGTATVRDLRLKIDTAGSLPLVLQTLIPATLSASEPITIDIDGGATDAPFGPSLDYLRHVFLWFLARMGITVQLIVSRRGYYPKGGARLSARIIPARPKPLTLDARGALTTLSIVSHASESLRIRKVAERQRDGALAAFGALAASPQCTTDYSPSLSPGSSICAVAGFADTVMGADCLGAPAKRAEQVGYEAATALLTEVGSAGCLDRHMADQVLPYLAITGERTFVTVSEVTNHCRTNMWVIENFLGSKFKINDNRIGWMAP